MSTDANPSVPAFEVLPGGAAHSGEQDSETCPNRVEHGAPLPSPRAFLLSPAPCGFGTAACESLPSYLRRVATTNGVSLGQLFFGRCMRAHARTRPDVALLLKAGGVPVREGSVSICPSGWVATSALARLAGRAPIMRLHWSTAFAGFSLARLVRRHLAWCPECLATDREPYARMAWDLPLVRACFLHQRPLLETCPKCQTPVPRFDALGDFARCPGCRVRLREFRGDRKATPRQVEVARQVGELIGAVTNGHWQATGTGAITTLLAWVETHGAQSTKQQARRLGITPSLLWYWKNRRHEPSLQRVLEISVRNSLPLVPVLRGDPVVDTGKLTRGGVSRAWAFNARSDSVRQRKACELQSLTSRLPPLTLAEVARRLGCSQRTLKSISREACVRIVDRAKAWSHRRHARRTRWLQYWIDRAIDAISHSGGIPTLRGIAAQLSKPGILREPAVNRYARSRIARRGAAAIDHR